MVADRLFLDYISINANTCKKELKEIYNQVYVVKSSNKGVEIVGEFE